jgi:methylaspartate mutase sigma subunit
VNHVILGVTVSDSHAVANHLIAHFLRSHGFRVTNLGVCTPLSEFMAAYDAEANALAIAIGSLNGHARADLDGLAELKAKHRVACPIFLGGNIVKDGDMHEAAAVFARCGVTKIIMSADELLQDLLMLQRARALKDTSSSGWLAAG